MFNKKCSKCKNKIKDNFEFCPSCGKNLKSDYDKQDFGILGKNDFIEEQMIPSLGDSMIDKMFSNALKVAEKMLEKQMKNISKEMVRPEQNTNPPIQIPNNLDIQFFVNGKRVFANPQQQIEKPKKPIRIENKFSDEQIEKLISLPKKEPSSKLKRLSGKIVYEIAVPGVKGIEDVLINQLESSIEIKALAKDKVYSKTLNINLPIIHLQINDGNLILELAAR